MANRKILGQTFKVKRGIGHKVPKDTILLVKVRNYPVEKYYSNSGNYHYEIFLEDGTKVFEHSSNYYSFINNWLRYEIKEES